MVSKGNKPMRMYYAEYEEIHQYLEKLGVFRLPNVVTDRHNIGLAKSKKHCLEWKKQDSMLSQLTTAIICYLWDILKGKRMYYIKLLQNLIILQSEN